MKRNDARKKKKADGNEIALERIGLLYGLAEKEAREGNLPLADSYVEKTRRIALKHNIRLTREYQTMSCKHCRGYLLPGKTSKTRINSKDKRVEVSCIRCGKKNLFPFLKEAKDRKRAKP